MSEQVDFFSGERWKKSHQYQKTLQLKRQETLGEIRYLDYCRISQHLCMAWLIEELNLWEAYWLPYLSSALKDLVPNKPYHVTRNSKRYGYTKEEGMQQAEFMAHKIISTIKSILSKNILKYEKIPDGGNYGNITGGWFGVNGQIQCNEWADKLENELLTIINNNKLYTFSIHYMRYVRSDADRFEAWQKWQQHHWVRVVGPSQRYVDIDPWPSGGRYIIPQTPHRPTGTISINGSTTIYGNWSTVGISPEYENLKPGEKPKQKKRRPE